MSEAIEALRAVVEHARVAFPGTPYRAALDRAREVVAAYDSQPQVVADIEPGWSGSCPTCGTFVRQNRGMEG